ncbi:MAG: phosphatase PAP2 family protein [Phycisphaerales bacterium]|nr:phosphatase PAP2 family protein [Phycisphaerales bacterium]
MPAERKDKSRASLLRVWLVIAASTALLLLMLRFDVQLLRWRDAFKHVEPHGALAQLLGGFRSFGEFLTTIVVIFIAAAYDRRRKNIIVALLIAQALSMIVYNAGKYAVVRQRPFHAVEQVALEELSASQTWLGWRLGNKTFETRSFPSGHSASAFAVAGILAFFYPRLRWMFWGLAVACATSRFVDVVHWPSDCVAGALIGYLSSVFAVSIAPKA